MLEKLPTKRLVPLTAACLAAIIALAVSSPAVAQNMGQVWSDASASAMTNRLLKYRPRARGCLCS